MKYLIAVPAFVFLLSLACRPVECPPVQDAAGYDADGTRPPLRVRLGDGWPSNLREVLRRVFYHHPEYVEAADGETADVTIQPVLPHAEDCASDGSEVVWDVVYVDWDCHAGDALHEEAARLLRTFR